MGRRANTPDDFWSKVERGDAHECWNWAASTDRHGYGQMMMLGKHMRSHRIAWIVTYGEIPDRKCVLHRCDNRRCCNPSHLFLGSPADNAVDRNTKMRHVHGARSPHAKLTDDDVRAIRSRHSNGEYQTDLAREYGVGTSTLNRIVTRQSWTHIKEEAPA